MKTTNKAQMRKVLAERKRIRKYIDRRIKERATKNDIYNELILFLPKKEARVWVFGEDFKEGKVGDNLRKFREECKRYKKGDDINVTKN